jgi:hypothetical protein
MKGNLKYFFLLIILFVALNCTGIILNFTFGLNIKATDLLIISFSFAAVSFISLLIFLRGRVKEEKEQTMYTFVAISLKFIMELVVALLWFIAAKKTSPEYILLFFVLYLAFSVFLIITILNVLKNKSL